MYSALLGHKTVVNPTANRYIIEDYNLSKTPDGTKLKPLLFTLFLGTVSKTDVRLRTQGKKKKPAHALVQKDHSKL